MREYLNKSFSWLLVLVVGLFIYREIVTVFNPIILFYDEAYYLGWAQSLEWGYFSKPPMVGWLIYLTTSLFGYEEWAVKLAAPVLYCLTSLIIFRIAQLLFDEKTAFISAVIFISMPMVSFNSLFITTDAPQVFFWALAMLCFFEALRSNAWHWWIFAGLVGGLGLLSKYTFIFLPTGFLLYGLWSSEGRQLLQNSRFWVACSLALIVFAPNLIWNAQHDFISFQHTAEISHLDESLFHLNKLMEFWLGQMGVFGPVFIFLLVVAAYRREALTENEKLLWCFFLPTFLGISLQSMLAKANINWAATAYIAASLLVGIQVVRASYYRLCIAGLSINLLFAIVFYHYHFFADQFDIQLSRSTDPYSRLVAWPDIVAQAQPYFDSHPQLKLASDNRDVLAYFGYYLKPRDFNGQKLRKTFMIEDHYELMYPIEEVSSNQQLMFVSKTMTKQDLNRYFEHVEFITKLQIPVYPKLVRAVSLYAVYGFRMSTLLDEQH